MDLLILIWLHMIGDYPLQGEFLAQMKGKNDYLLLCHSVIWTGCIVAGLMYLGVFTPWKAAFLLIGHFLIDRWKARMQDKTHALTVDLWTDQAAHLIQLIVCLGW
jgi:hypothetical protein